VGFELMTLNVIHRGASSTSERQLLIFSGESRGLS